MANWRGTWASGTAYIADDSVTSDGVTYFCVTANTGQTPGTGADWAVQDTFTGPGAAKSIEGVTVSGTPSSGKVITATSATAANWQTPAAGVTLDTTASDIAALGSQAAGAAGKAADAGHVHPTTGVLLSGATAGGVLTGTYPSPSGLAATAVTAGSYTNAGITVAADGRLTAASSGSASGMANPMTTAGDLIDGGTGGTPARLGGNTSATKNYLTSTGTGSAAQAPVWAAIAAGDLPAGTTSTQGALQIDGTAGDIAAPGTQAAGAIGKAADAGHVHPVTGWASPLAIGSGGTGSQTQNFTGLRTPSAVVTTSGSPYAASAGEYVRTDVSAGNVTVTLPSAPPANTVIGVKQIAVSGSFKTTYACSGTDVINVAAGATSGTLTVLSQAATLQYNAGIWLVQSSDLPLSQADLRYAQLANNLSEYTATASTARTNLGLTAAPSNTPTVITATNATWPIPSGAAWLEITAAGGGGQGGGSGSLGTSTLTVALVTSPNTTSLTFTANPQALASGATITVVSGANTQTFTTTATCALNATTVAVTSVAANYAYPAAGGTQINGSTWAQVGGGGGAAGCASTQVVAAGANTALNVTIGAGGSAAGGGGANTGATGIAGSAGTATTVTGVGGTGIAVTGAGGPGGGPSAASSATGGGGGIFGQTLPLGGNYGPGQGGYQGAGGAPNGGAAGGGGSGGTATYTLGGRAGGAAGTAIAGGAGGGGGGLGTPGGGAGSAAAANSGAGGGAGGGAYSGGVGGAGGAGGSGFVIVRVVG